MRKTNHIKVVLLLILLAGGCVATGVSLNDEYLDPPIPPRYSKFANQYAERRSIVEYHRALHLYMNQLGRHISMLESTYNLPVASIASACDHISMDLIVLPEIPDISGMSDEDAMLTLVAHIDTLRTSIGYNNGAVVAHNRSASERLASCIAIN